MPGLSSPRSSKRMPEVVLAPVWKGSLLIQDWLSGYGLARSKLPRATRPQGSIGTICGTLIAGRSQHIGNTLKVVTTGHCNRSSILPSPTKGNKRSCWTGLLGLFNMRRQNQPGPFCCSPKKKELEKPRSVSFWRNCLVRRIRQR